ncbi:MAG: hypothetical protein ACO1PM_22120 [Acidovorax sp.]
MRWPAWSRRSNSPFASSAPIALIGLALLVRDGALMVVASLLACGAAGLLIASLL